MTTRIFSRNYQPARDAIATAGLVDSEAPSTSAASNIGTDELHIVFEPIRETSRWTVAHRARPWALRKGRTGYGTALSWHGTLARALAAAAALAPQGQTTMNAALQHELAIEAAIEARYQYRTTAQLWDDYQSAQSEADAWQHAYDAARDAHNKPAMAAAADKWNAASDEAAAIAYALSVR